MGDEQPYLYLLHNNRNNKLALLNLSISMNRVGVIKFMKTVLRKEKNRIENTTIAGSEYGMSNECGRCVHLAVFLITKERRLFKPHKEAE